MLEGVLLDLDGTLVVSWEPIPGAIDAVARLRAAGVPFRIVTNTTTHSRRSLAATLREAGFDVREEELFTATVATAAYLRSHHTGKRCLLLAEGDALEDLEGIEAADEECGVVVIGDAEDKLSYANMNRAFRMLLGGAELVAMHRGLYWMTADGLQLDIGAFVKGLEEAAGVKAVVCGKPSPEFFLGAVGSLGVPAARVAMAGDDVATDVLAAQEVGMTGVLVRTGKFRPQDVERAGSVPIRVVDSVADVPALVLGEGK